MNKKLLIIIGFIVGLSFSQAQPADFMVGRYELVNGVSSFGPALGLTNFAEGIVDISIGNSPNLRVFSVQSLPEVAGPVVQIVLDLSNNEFLFPVVNTGFSCGGAPLIDYGAASTGNNSVWSTVAGDQNLTINYTENTLGACNQPTTPASLILTEFPADQTFVPDDNFEQALINLGLDTVLDDRITTANIDAITNLDISNEGISDLTGLNDFVGLTDLNISINQIAGSLDLTNLTNLISVSAESNQLTNFIGPNSVEFISLGVNQVTENDYSSYANLESLFINQNPIENNLIVPDSIIVLNSFGTSITSADLSNTTLLTSLVISNNSQLEYLNLKNNNNSNLAFFIGNNNPNLMCIEVDDVNYMTTNYATQIDSGQSFIVSCSNSTQTFVPDDNFEQELIAQGFDTVLDNFVTNSNVNTETVLDISNKAIVNLRGLEAFVALDTLRAADNAIVSFNSMQVNNARFIDLASNPIVDVDMSGNNSITYASFFFNFSLQNVDISGSNSLEFFDAVLSKITAINTSNNPNLVILRLAATNELTSIDVSQNPLLERLDLLSCPLLTGIDITQNPQLEFLRFGLNNFDPSTNTDYPITSIDLSNNTNLVELINFGGRINMVDTSMLTNLEDFTWIFSGLTSLDLSNQTMLNRTFIYDNALTSLTLPVTATNLNNVSAGNNQLTNFDASGYPNLAFLRFANNQVNTFNISNSPAIEVLDISNNSLSILDLSSRPSLTQVIMNDNLITSIDLSGSPLLDTFFGDNNDLMFLNVDNGANNLITGFSTLGNTNLVCIKISDLNYMNTSFGMNIDATASFNTICGTASLEDVEIALSLYPNPVVDYVNIEVTASEIETVSVYDLAGKMVKQVAPNSVANSYQLQMNDLGSGQYLLVIDTNSGRTAKSIIKN